MLLILFSLLSSCQCNFESACCWWRGVSRPRKTWRLVNCWMFLDQRWISTHIKKICFACVGHFCARQNILSGLFLNSRFFCFYSIWSDGVRLTIRQFSSRRRRFAGGLTPISFLYFFLFQSQLIGSRRLNRLSVRRERSWKDKSPPNLQVSSHRSMKRPASEVLYAYTLLQQPLAIMDVMQVCNLQTIFFPLFFTKFLFRLLKTPLRGLCFQGKMGGWGRGNEETVRVGNKALCYFVGTECWHLAARWTEPTNTSCF